MDKRLENLEMVVPESLDADFTYAYGDGAEDEMTMNAYQQLAARTINTELSKPDQGKHALFGMCSEIGELHSLYQKRYQGHLFDEQHAKKELGDLLWFIAEYCTAHGWTMDEIATMNIDKLKARYPDGFTEERSLNRANGDV